MVSDIYNRIGQRIVDSISDNWSEASLSLQYIGSVESSLNYLNDSGDSVSIPLNDSFQNALDVRELHKITTSDSHNRWNTLNFKLKPDGDFNIEFSWNQEAQDEVESYIEK